ncbi:hypothetical protein BD626DRAFT_414749 [Schizophyllum amplum]|uniref:BTB domain-containing protein n=1 Tax=Schizophyllum amplum TaxID=97359 RepID=A0A550BU92_9AGAR|nr:hypothetical protein BD626DRAFT_414749 [Auriculariopsis ampla]
MDSSNVAPEQCTRDAELWLNDGNLILQDACLFRVHHSVLAMHSLFFHDLETIPQGEAQAAYDGAPLVALCGDEPADVRHFLKALYFPHYLPPPPMQASVDIIFGVLRLAHKYQALQWRCCALRHLSKIFATDLETHLDVDDQSAHTIRIALALAQEVGAAWLLPSIYLGAMFFPETMISSSESLEGRPACLAHNDLAIIFSAMSEVQRMFPRYVFLLPGHQCYNYKCAMARLQLSLGDGDSRFSESPLDFLDDILDDEDDTDAVCATCLADMRLHYQEWKKGLWDALPTIYRLPAWPELLEMKKRDLEVR